MDISHCDLCPRRCGVDRRTETGFCKSGEQAHIARAALHFWEEPCISGTRGSGTVFFTDCNLQCVFCQNYDISTGQNTGTAVSAEDLCRIFRNLVQQGAHNINLVTPTHYAAVIKEALEMEKPPVPVVYNSSGYESVDTLRSLEGLVDIYLPDFKYADDRLALRYSRAPGYKETAGEAIAEMLRQTGPAQFGEDGLLQRGTLIRHLILPSHTRNSIAVLRYIEQRFGRDVPVSLMAQYVPMGRAADFPEIDRTITQAELKRVLGEVERLGLRGYVQELGAADTAYIPPFNGEGVKL